MSKDKVIKVTELIAHKTRVKMASGTNSYELQESINKILQNTNEKVVDIKYQVMPPNKYNYYETYSAMIIFEYSEPKA